MAPAGACIVVIGNVLSYRTRDLTRPSPTLVKEVEGLKQMVEDIMEKVAGLRVEDKGEETGSIVTMTGVNQYREDQAREEAAGNTRTEETITGDEDEGEIRTEETITGVEDEGEIRTEEMITGVEDEGEIRTEERKEICSGARCSD